MKYFTGVALALTITGSARADFPRVLVSVTNNAPADGVFLTPIWVGFHNGSFDSYNRGLSSQLGLERIAEDGNAEPISADFGNGLTYIDVSVATPASATVDSGQPGTERVQGVIGSGPIGPGITVEQEFDLEAVLNRYLSYGSMVLSSNDYFVANGDPLAHDLNSLYGAPVGTSVTFSIGTSVNDAGVEVNDFATSAGNGRFSSLPNGQAGPNTGADESGVVALVESPYADFQNRPADFDTGFAAFAFNDTALYPSGIATVSVTVVPEPSALVLLMSVGVMALSIRRKR